MAKRTAKIEICGTTVFWWRLVGSNGKIICNSKTFATRSNALRAAKRAKQVMLTAEVVDER